MSDDNIQYLENGNRVLKLERRGYTFPRNIIAARAGIRSFALSPPGLFFGTQKMGVDSFADLSSHTVSVIPEWDMVPTADGHAGTVIHVPCSVPRTMSNIKKSVACHSCSRTLAMLALACVDKQYPHRKWEIIDYPNSDAGKRHVKIAAGAGGKSISGESAVSVPYGWL